jgi:hypothetical protein
MIGEILPNKRLKLTVACGSRSLAAGRYAATSSVFWKRKLAI